MPPKCIWGTLSLGSRKKIRKGREETEMERDEEYRRGRQVGQGNERM